MEEILASIRKILNEDDTPPEAREAAGEGVAEEVLVLDETMMVTAPAPQPAQPEVSPGEPLRAPAAAAPSSVNAAQEPAPPPPAAEPGNGGLLAPETAAAAASSLGSLMRTLSAGRNVQVHAGGPTLEDMVRGELRPLVRSWLEAHLPGVMEALVRAEVRDQLKTWLDLHLPPLVERLVQAEIERVVGSGGA